MTPHSGMSGSVTVSTFYCIVSKAFIGFRFLGRQFLKCLLFLVLTLVLASLCTVAWWGMLKHFGPLRPIWCVWQQACDVHKLRSLRKWLCGQRKMWPHENPVSATRALDLGATESVEQKVRQAFRVQTADRNCSQEDPFLYPNARTYRRTILCRPAEPGRVPPSTLPLKLWLEYMVFPFLTLLSDFLSYSSPATGIALFF